MSVLEIPDCWTSLTDFGASYHLHFQMEPSPSFRLYKFGLELQIFTTEVQTSIPYQQLQDLVLEDLQNLET